jgi:DNA-directed RNA polymerase subunit E"
VISRFSNAKTANLKSRRIIKNNMAGKKACKSCKTLYEGDKCPKCASVEFTESWKGKVIILNPEKSEVAQKLKINEKGAYAIKTR